MIWTCLNETWAAAWALCALTLTHTQWYETEKKFKSMWSVKNLKELKHDESPLSSSVLWAQCNINHFVPTESEFLIECQINKVFSVWDSRHWSVRIAAHLWKSSMPMMWLLPSERFLLISHSSVSCFILTDLTLPSCAIRIIVNMCFLVRNRTWTPSQLIFTTRKL